MQKNRLHESVSNGQRDRPKVLSAPINAVRRTVSPNTSIEHRTSAILKQSPLTLVAARKDAKEKGTFVPEQRLQVSRLIPPPPAAKSASRPDDRAVLRLVRAGDIGAQHIERHSDPLAGIDDVKQTVSSRTRAAFSQKNLAQNNKGDLKKKLESKVAGGPIASHPPPATTTTRRVIRSASPWGPSTVSLAPQIPSRSGLLGPDSQDGRHRWPASGMPVSRASSTSRPPATSRKVVSSESMMSAAIKSAVNLRLREFAMGQRTTSSGRPVTAIPHSTKRAVADPHNGSTTPKSSLDPPKDVPASRVPQHRFSAPRPPPAPTASRCPPPPYAVRITKVAVYEAVDASVARVRNTISPPRGKHEEN